jgi:hypothetical protein
MSIEVAEIGSNGSRRHKKRAFMTLADVDGRTNAAKNARALVAALESDIGVDLSAAERELAQRAGILGAVLEDSETRWIAGEPFDLALYGSLVNVQRRVLETLGIKRQARDVSPSLEAYTRQLDGVAKK